MDTPLYTRLLDYHSKNRISFAMPGHKSGRGLAKNLLECDVTELEATENLHHPREFVKNSNALLAKLYGADESFIMTGGSTAGIQAMIAASLYPNGTLLAGADCHMSVINTCALLGINLRFVPSEIDTEFLIPKGVCPNGTYGADTMLLTSPNYYGLCADIEAAAKLCKADKIPLLADEAHGAHFVSDSRFPKSALTLGADAVCQSAHKTLNAINGAAFLHIKNGMICRERIARALTMFQSSSPSYVIAVSADIARAELSNQDWNRTIAMCESFKEKITANTDIKALDNDDPTRLVLNFGAYDISGFEVGSILSKNHGIDIEMADLLNIVLIVTPSNTKSDMDALHFALTDITQGLNRRKNYPKIPSPPICGEIISPSEAFFGEHEYIPFEKSAGRTAASVVTAYPPGIPVICMGADITKEQIDYILMLQEYGAEITGIDSGFICVRK